MSIKPPQCLAHPLLSCRVLLLPVLALAAGCPARTNCRTERATVKVLSVRYDQQTFAVMRRVLRADSTSIDVGAFKGNILAKMVEFAPRGKHYAFEPLPKFAAVVRKRFPSPLIKVHEMALGDHQGTVTFQFVVSNPAYSGIKQRNYPHKREKIVPIQVRLDTLDNVLPPDAKVAFIKIDVEGGEFGVLKGAVKTVRRCRPVIVFEFGGAAAKYGVTPAKIYDLITKTLGLQVNLMSCWLKGERPLTKAEFVEQYKAARNFYYIAYPGK